MDNNMQYIVEKDKKQTPLPNRFFAWLRNGSGTALLGSYICMIVAFCMVLLTNNIVMYHHATMTQAAVDSLSDGTAVHSYLYAGEYDDAVGHANSLRNIIKDAMGIDLQNVTIDRDSFEERNIKVTASSQRESIGGGTPVSMTRTATTTFMGISYGDDYLSWMSHVAADDYFGYSTGEDPYTTSRDLGPDTDCSGLIYWGMYYTGYYVPDDMWYSGDIHGYLVGMGFQEIPITGATTEADVMPGDVLYHTAEFSGTRYGHVTTVYSVDENGIMEVAAHGGHDTPQAHDQTGSEISVCPFSNLHSYQYILRPTANIPKKPRSEWPQMQAHPVSWE